MTENNAYECPRCKRLREDLAVMDKEVKHA